MKVTLICPSPDVVMISPVTGVVAHSGGHTRIYHIIYAGTMWIEWRLMRLRPRLTCRWSKKWRPALH